MRWVGLLLLIASSAGCLGGNGGGSGIGSEPAPEVADGTWTHVALDGACRMACFELTVAPVGDGRVVIADAVDGSLWVGSAETGFEVRDGPPIPSAGSVDGYRILDRTVQAGPDGRVWYTALLAPAGAAPTGVHIASTEDEGLTWATNVVVDLGAGHVQGMQADRQWLGFDGGSMLLSVNFFSPVLSPNPPPFGIWASSSSDGEEWAPFELVATHEERGLFNGVSGPPVPALDSMVIPMGFRTDASGMALARQTASGWEILEVLAGDHPTAAEWLPTAITHEDHVVAGWVDEGGAIVLARSQDGKTWDGPLVLSQTGVHSPWLVSAGGDVFVAWYNNTGPHLEVTRLDGGWAKEAPRGVVISEPIEANVGGFSDFPSLASDGGSIYAVWGSSDLPTPQLVVHAIGNDSR